MLYFFKTFKMENIRKKGKKDYFNRFVKLNIYSYTKGDKKIYLGAKPEEVFSLFNGNTSSIKKEIGKENNNIDDKSIDQSTLQYYLILALQDFYQNYYIPLAEDNKALKEDINMLQHILKDIKKKNNDRFDYITSIINNK